jgi:hypothetical protein
MRVAVDISGKLTDPSFGGGVRRSPVVKAGRPEGSEISIARIWRSAQKALVLVGCGAAPWVAILWAAGII